MSLLRWLLGAFWSAILRKFDAQKEKTRGREKEIAEGGKSRKKDKTREKEQMRGGQAWEGKAGGESLGRRRGGGGGGQEA